MKKNRKYKKGKNFDLGDWFVNTNHKDDYSDLRKFYDVLIDTIPGCIEIITSRSRIHNGYLFSDDVSKKVYQRIVELLYDSEPENFLKEFNKVCRELLSLADAPEEASYEGDKSEIPGREELRSERHRVRTETLIKKIIGKGSRYPNIARVYEDALMAPTYFQKLLLQVPKHNQY